MRRRPIPRCFDRLAAIGAGGASAAGAAASPAPSRPTHGAVASKTAALTMGTQASPVTVGLGASYSTIAPGASVPGSFVWNTTALAAGSHPLAVVARGAGALPSTSPPVHPTGDAVTELTRDRFAAARAGGVRAARVRAASPRG